MEKVNFHYIGVLLDMMYGISVEDEVLEELGLIGWKLIGNKTTRLYKYTTSTDNNNSIKLPCNAYHVEAVTLPYEDGNCLEQIIEQLKRNKSPLYIPGKLVKYFQSDDVLTFSQPYNALTIVYKGIMMDEDGLPELTDKEALALATYIAYIRKFKEGLVTNNDNTIKASSHLQAQWLKQCDQARITDLSQNAMNEILEVRNSWNRASYGYSFKLRQ